MKPVSITPDQTVARVLQTYPETIHAWIAVQTHCVGCYLMRFCSLEDVAHSYDMELSVLLDELEKAIYYKDRGT
jgi:hybrid cluster-associated redox disulfide protein